MANYGPQPAIVNNGAFYFAPSFGGNWTSSGDVGAAINAAIAAAASAGGGTVILPAGIFGVSTPIVQSTSGVRVVGAGYGDPRTTNNPSTYTAITHLVWNGSAGATMFRLYGGSSGLQTIAADVIGIVFDCASLANVGFYATNVSFSTIKVGGAEARSVCVWFDTNGSTPGPGNQHNDCWLYSRSTSSTYSPTGILIDGGSGATFNSSYSRYYDLYSWYAQGDGIVFGSADNNVIFMIEATGNPSNGTGLPVVFASSNHIMPNGNSVNGAATANYVEHMGSISVLQGYRAGTTITAGSGNTGTAAVNTVTLTTNSTTAFQNSTLHFSATTNVLAGMTLNGGGTNSGILTGSTVSSVTGTTVVMQQGAVGAVSSSTSVAFTFGINASAVAGTYTMTCVDSTHWSLTAPAGGHSQADIAVASSAISFTDMVIPLTGTPVASDTFTIVVATPATNTTVALVDASNSQPVPIVCPGSYGFVGTTSAPSLIEYGGTGNFFVNNLLSSGNGSISIGTSNTSSGSSSACIGGFGNSATGFGSATYGGHNLAASGTYAFAINDSNTAQGQDCFVAGADATDRARSFCDVWGGLNFSVQGDCQVVRQMLSVTTSGSSAVRATAGQGSASTNNIVNLPNSTAYALTVTMVAFDHTTPANNYSASWGLNSAPMLLTRGANAASTLLNGVTSTISPDVTRSNGTVTGLVVTLAADTTNGGLNAEFTPPTGNTDTWRAAFFVESVEVQ